jgi:ribosomal protein S18 acetylase RimI-like enzyme
MSRIRKLNPSDVADAAAVLHSVESWNSGEGFRERSREVLESVAGREGLYVGEENETVAGVVWFLPEPVFANGGLVILLAVRPEMRRHGIGRQLLGFTERKIFNQSQSAFFSISSHNSPGLQFLAKMGYMKVCEIPSPVESGSPQWVLRKTAHPRRNEFPKTDGNR